MQLEGLTTKMLGRNLIYYQEVDSTQLEIERKIKKNEIKSGTILLTEIQTKGKGTHGRKWYTDEKNNIAFSFFLEADCEIKKLEGITIEIAETLVEVLETLYSISLQIKFPNDLVFHGKKIGGILTETKVRGEKVEAIIVGIRNEYQSNNVSKGNRRSGNFHPKRIWNRN